MHSSDLITLSDLYALHQKRSPATISNRIVGHARLFSRLKQGHGTTIKTYQLALSWFDRNWPEGLQWPDGIARPSASRRSAA